MNDNTWITYRLENGSPIYGEYSWVDTPEFFDGVLETTKVIKETWILADSEIVTFEPVFWSAEDYDEDEF